MGYTEEHRWCEPLARIKGLQLAIFRRVGILGELGLVMG